MNLATLFSSFTSSKSSQTQYVGQQQSGAAKGATNETGAREDRVELSYSQSTRLTYSAKVAGESAPEPDDSRTTAANNILGFIGARLRLDVSEGASEEQLASRLEAGLSGFVQGYQEAYDQLSGMGFLYPEVETAIEKTFTDVLDGIDELAEELGISSPVTEELRQSQTDRREAFVPAEPSVADALASEVEDPVAQAPQGLIRSLLPEAPSEFAQQNTEAANLKNLIEASSFDYRERESRSFSFSLKTQDGDSVVIKAAYASSALLEGQSVNYTFGEGQTVSGSFRAASGFYLDVRGELDEEELLAIEDLLTQVREVSDQFFAGDIQAAFDSAVDLGFNSEEIAQFSLRLRYQYSAAYRETTESYSPSKSSPSEGAAKLKSLAEKDESLMTLARFIQALEDMRLKAEELGVANFIGNNLAFDNEDSARGPRGIVADLLSRLEALANADQATSEDDL